MTDSPTPESPESTPTALLQLDGVEARIVACLIEKQATTPDQYPLTVNAAVVASNQKTSREPVMELELGAVGHALRQLEDKGLVRVVHGSRALRYEHRFDEIYVTTPRQRAMLCTLMLRGAQTLNELYTRSERIGSFPSVEDVRDTLDRLIQRNPPMAVRLPRSPGQREERYVHLLCGAAAAERAALVSSESGSGSGGGASSGKLEDLEQRVSDLEQQLAAVLAEVERLKRV